MASPVMTFNAAGNIRASASLGAGANASYSVDYSGKLEGQVTIKNTPGGTVASTRGLRCEFFPRYGSSPADTTIAPIAIDMPSQTASTAESRTFFLPTGKWTMKVSNLDVTNAITVEITDATIDSLT